MSEVLATGAAVKPLPQTSATPRAGMPVAVRVLLRYGSPIGVLSLQILGVVTVTFLLIQFMPGNAAELIAGPYASREEVAAVEQRLGLDQSLTAQYWQYISGVARGDLGTSLSTGNPVALDLAERLPATLGLITIALLASGLLTLGLTWLVVAWPNTWMGRFIKSYTVFGAGIPDFWLGLLLVFVFYFTLGVAPAPSGQLDSELGIPRWTNFGLLDAVLAGRPDGVLNALGHLALPVATLTIVSAASMTRLTAASAMAAMEQDHIRFANALGVRNWRVNWYVVRSALPTFISTSSLVYSGLLGGAVVVETVYGWAGLGQYGVDAIINADYAALQGFVIVAGIFTAVVYAVVEVAYRIANPKART